MRGTAVETGVKLAVMALMLAGCASSAREPAMLSVEGDEFVQQAAAAAVAEWHSVCGAEVSIGMGGIPVRPADVGSHGGETETKGGRVVWVAYRRQDSADGMRALLTHEIGHVLGLGHTPEGVADIMAAEATDVRHVRPEDCAGL